LFIHYIALPKLLSLWALEPFPILIIDDSLVDNNGAHSDFSESTGEIDVSTDLFPKPLKALSPQADDNAHCLVR